MLSLSCCLDVDAPHTEVYDSCLNCDRVLLWRMSEPEVENRVEHDAIGAMLTDSVTGSVEFDVDPASAALFSIFRHARANCSCFLQPCFPFGAD